jgi:hypothetical protein
MAKKSFVMEMLAAGLVFGIQQYGEASGDAIALNLAVDSGRRYL